jgi:capsular polysaccharide biosynthesis protein
MELRNYWRILQRRLWLVAALLLAFGLSYVASAKPAPSYAAQMRFVVGIRPEPARGDVYRYDRYYTWLTAEYLVDDLSEVVKSRAFAEDVSNAAGVAVPVGAIQGATAAGKLHRLLTVTLTWHDAAELDRLAQAVVRTLQEDGGRYFAQLGTEEAVISVVDPPQVSAVGPSLRQRLDLPLRLILALIAGIGLAFLADYLDPTVRSRHDLEEAGVVILAEVPRQRLHLRWRRRAP